MCQIFDGRNLQAFNCAALLGPMPFIFVSSVDDLLGADGGWCGLSSVSSIFGGLVGAAILCTYALGRAEYPDAMKNKPNSSRTIRYAVGSRATPKNGIMSVARMIQMIPSAYESISNRNGSHAGSG